MRRFAQDQAYNFFEVEKKIREKVIYIEALFLSRWYMLVPVVALLAVRTRDPFIQFLSFGLVNNLLILNIITFATVAKMRIFEDSL